MTPAVRIFLGPIVMEDVLLVARHRIEKQFKTIFPDTPIQWWECFLLISDIEQVNGFAIIELWEDAYLVLDYNRLRAFGTKKSMCWDNEFDVMTKKLPSIIDECLSRLEKKRGRE